jgi:hypothetical protein
VAPRPENSDTGEKDALFGLDSQIINSFCFAHLDFSKITDINFICCSCGLSWNWDSLNIE